ncbi:uncharacterized protein LOC136090778 [Hydra vulgaris]|uniref:Uncharacterized protein LOC136090778 n=1 Tax=Hydra vulgaris TaxID=6087 RepID=A0ABM4DH02_HYDVU
MLKSVYIMSNFYFTGLQPPKKYYIKHKTNIKGGLREIDIQLAKDMCSIGIETTPGFKMCPSCRRAVVKKKDVWSPYRTTMVNDFLVQLFFDEGIEITQEKEVLNTNFDKLDISAVKN